MYAAMSDDPWKSPTGDADLPPAGLSWGEYVERWVADCGGWLPLADQLIHRAGDAVEIALDPGTVERGLRRLSTRAHKPGGQYGRWMLRFFGFTSPIEQWVKWLGMYHTRFADLPSSLRLEQLALWNRPPISESPLACWISIGTAAAHYSRLDTTAFEHWIARAERQATSAGVAAEIEIALLRAQVETDALDRDRPQERWNLIEKRLAEHVLPPADSQVYRARLHHQRAMHCTLLPELDGRPPDIERARELYEAIPDSTHPFAACRKSVGLAYCAWKNGDTGEAVRLAHRAADEAGDGGLVRMRVMALNLLSRVLAPDQAAIVNERARRMANALEDEDLVRRVAWATPKPPRASPLQE